MEVRQGDPLQWLAQSPRALERVPELPKVTQVADRHAASAHVATWAATRGLNTWELSCVIACQFSNSERTGLFLCAALPPIECACGRRYTVEHSHGTKDGSLFCEVNRDLRELARANQATRELLINTWGPFMHSCIQGLTKCPTVAPGTVTWKARPEDIYHQGEELIFCSFTSSTLDFKVACHTAGYSKGTILELSLLEGFQLDDVSVHPRESEVLLPPNRRFAVTSAPMTQRVSGPHGEDGPPPNKNANVPRTLTPNGNQELVNAIKLQQLTLDLTWG